MWRYLQQQNHHWTPSLQCRHHQQQKEQQTLHRQPQHSAQPQQHQQHRQQQHQIQQQQQQPQQHQQQHRQHQQHPQITNCGGCGLHHSNFQECRARHLYCYRCGHQGHFGRKCHSKQKKKNKSSRKQARDRQRMQEFLHRKSTDNHLPFSSETNVCTLFDPTSCIKEELSNIKKQLQETQRQLKQRKTDVEAAEATSKKVAWMKDKLESTMRKLAETSKEKNYLQDQLQDKEKKHTQQQANKTAEVSALQLKLTQEYNKAKDNHLEYMNERLQNYREFHENNNKHFSKELMQTKEKLAMVQGKLKTAERSHTETTATVNSLRIQCEKQKKQLNQVNRKLKTAEEGRDSAEWLYEDLKRIRNPQPSDCHFRPPNNNPKKVYYAKYSGRTRLRDCT